MKPSDSEVSPERLVVHTIGHSTRPIEEFIELLNRNDVDVLIDVRSVPGSRHNPQFGESELRTSMPDAGIAYRQIKNLGGLRRTHVNEQSINEAWRNKSFRSYADYMQTSDFDAGIEELVTVAEHHRVAIMCAEAVPWRCHRSLIGDALLVRGIQVLDIMGRNSTKPHTLTSFAKVKGHQVWYPPTD